MFRLIYAPCQYVYEYFGNGMFSTIIYTHINGKNKLYDFPSGTSTRFRVNWWRQCNCYNRTRRKLCQFLFFVLFFFQLKIQIHFISGISISTKLFLYNNSTEKLKKKFFVACLWSHRIIIWNWLVVDKYQIT